MAAYVASRGSCVFINRDFVGISLAKRCWTLGTSVSRWYQDINASTYGLRSVSWQNEDCWQIPGSLGRNEELGTRARKTRGRLRHRLSRNHLSLLGSHKQINTRPDLLPSSCKINGGQIRFGEGSAKCLSRNV